MACYRHVCLFGLMVVLAPCYVRAEITVNDGDFLNWSVTEIVQQDNPGLLVEVFSNVESSGGNPGAFYRFEHRYLGPNVFRTLNINKDFSFSPQEGGEVFGITFRYDLIGIQINPSFSNGIGFEPLIVQGDSVYRGPNTIATPDTTTWTRFVLRDLTPGDFKRIAGSGLAAPNFSADGDEMYFGFASQNGTDGNPASPVTQIGGIDNWRVSIRTIDARLGDVNLDGVVDLQDVDPFLNLLSMGMYQLEADTNCDGVLNLLDVAPFVSILAGD